MPDVVVTGTGAVTPLGPDVAATWQAAVKGSSGARRVEALSAGKVHIAAPVTCPVGLDSSGPERRRLDRSVLMALTAWREAWRQAGLTGSTAVDPERISVVMASIAGGISAFFDGHDALRETGRISPYVLAKFLPNGAASQVGIAVGARGEVHAPSNGCASAATAIAQGADLIRAGRADVVIAGGTEAPIHPTVIASFDTMRALSRRNDEPERASRPFDRGRDGFVLGEGAGVLVLERAAHAAARGATPLAALLGTGISTDAYHIVRPRPDGDATATALRRALRDADLDAGAVTHLNAHATGTEIGDLAEAHAIRAVFGDHCADLVVSATKSMTGHLQGAAGAVEAILAIQALRERLAPPTVNLDDPDERIGLRTTRAEPVGLGAGPQVAASNSAGFGGTNACVLFG